MRSYRKRFDKVESIIRSTLEPRFQIVTGKDIPSGNFLAAMYSEMRSSAFGIVVLGGLRQTTREGRNAVHEAKLNVGFEYGMLVGVSIPVLALLVDEERLDIESEFSDIEGEVYHRISLRARKSELRKRIVRIMAAFERNLPGIRAQLWKERVAGIPGPDRRIVSQALDEVARIARYGGRRS